LPARVLFGTDDILLVVFFLSLSTPAFAQSAEVKDCARFAEGSVVAAPQEIRSQDGVLQVSLSLRTSAGPSGQALYCYVDESGNLAPTLRVNPGDRMILKLKNDLPNSATTMPSFSAGNGTPCAGGGMTSGSTNLHFHGLTISPSCHQDDVLRTTIQPGAAAHEYHFQIPRRQPPGLYWYHPHVHGHSEEQVLGGASGALIVEGIERSNRLLAGLPERLLVIRDQAGPKLQVEGSPKPPSKDLSVNFIPVPYPKYPPAMLRVKPLQRELWRVLNASADTFLDLHLLTDGKWQSLGLVALDGAPLGYEVTSHEKAGHEVNAEKLIQWTPNIPIPPGGRAEFIFDSPAEGIRAQLLTAGVDTVPFVDEDDPASVAAVSKGTSIPDDDDYTPPRWLITIVAASDALAPTSILPRAPSAVSGAAAFYPEKQAKPSLIRVRPTRRRKLYFSEKILDPKNPRASTVFYLTEEGHRPSPFNPEDPPNITVRQGDVEDWVIENRSQEAHTFHIHQTHFIVLEAEEKEREDKAAGQNSLRDTVAVPYWDGVSSHYPSVKLRMDFRDPAIVGTFPYHCHILQHEDGGMMSTIRVMKKVAARRNRSVASSR
jgi:FtsP/CotA-like multicopper oxidase with cupredoxin domain